MADIDQVAGQRDPVGAVALLFSGGLDTTLEVVELLRTYREVHLLTFNNGFCINMQGAVRRARELIERYGSARIFHTVVDTHPLIRQILQDFRGLWKEYKSPLIFDMGCKLSSATELIYYAVTHEIEDICDGSAIDQTHIFIQHPEFGAHIKPYFNRYNLRFLKPVFFDMGRPEKIRKLEELDFRSGSETLEKIHITSQIAHQPFCMVGFLTFFFTSPLNRLKLVQHFALPMEQAKELWDRLLPRARTWLDDKLASAASG